MEALVPVGDTRLTSKNLHKRRSVGCLTRFQDITMPEEHAALETADTLGSEQEAGSQSNFPAKSESSHVLAKVLVSGKRLI